jgi:hypothetical protein
MTTKSYKANDNNVIDTCERVVLPLPDLNAESSDMEIYARFMRHMRLVPNTRMDIKILSAIQFTSDMMDMNDVLVAKSLANMGLRAPRRAFPTSYLEYLDDSLMRTGFEVGGPTQTALAMKDHWEAIGDSVSASYKGCEIVTDPLHPL